VQAAIGQEVGIKMPGPFWGTQINLVDELSKATINNPNFDIHKWSLFDADRLERAARMIRREMDERKKNEPS
jgi:hypothetical protein